MNAPGGGQGHGSRGASVGHLLAEGRRYLGLGRLQFAEQSFRAALAVDSTCTAAAEGLKQVEEARQNGEIDVDDEFGDDATVVDPRIFLDQGEAAPALPPLEPASGIPTPPSVVIAPMPTGEQPAQPGEHTPAPRAAPPTDGSRTPPPVLPPTLSPPGARPVHTPGIAESFPPGTFLSPKVGPRQVHLTMPVLVGSGIAIALFGVLVGALLF